ncbi:uncharacterized protein TNCV_3992351 [Trichonephila clavipes]|uniref:Uncharacterized protein n=1 Tax=Trichonephila clavipes TaxID=2585209 RepID=A0A8X6SXL9_TRICX|nr:uncharacterized protein TNCV_3992351 [Trichonephila clavipes]
MSPEFPADRWEGVDGLQFVGQAYPTHALLDSSTVSMLENPYGDILRLKAFVCNVCTVMTGVVIHKQKFSTHGTPKQAYMLFQNDIPIDVACHRYTLNMQASSGIKNNFSPNTRAILHHRNGVVQWCSLGGNGYLALSILKSGENKTAN